MDSKKLPNILEDLILGNHKDLKKSYQALERAKSKKSKIQGNLGLDFNIESTDLTKFQTSYYRNLSLNGLVSSSKLIKADLNDIKEKHWGKFFHGKITKKKLVDFASSLRNTLFESKSLKKGTCHWEYLLREMEWMSKDFRKESKDRLIHSKKIANLAKRQHSKRKNAKNRAHKHRRARLKVNMSKLSREVKIYWEKIDKLSVFKLKEVKKTKQDRGMERHLDKILRKTAKYSTALASRLDIEDDEESSSASDYEIDEDLEPTAEEAKRELEALKRDNATHSNSDECETKETDTHIGDQQAVFDTGESIEPQMAFYKYKQPFLLAKGVVLRNYQRTGLDWLVGLHRNNLNGILADEMGLGKTIQTIALFAFLAGYEQFWGPHLIIVPSSVVLNWELEFKRFFPGFKVMSYYGSLKERKEKRIGWNRTGTNADLKTSFNVLVTSYKLAVQDANMLKRRKWGYLVLDEAHHIKNFKSQRWQVLLNFNAKRRLLLTGTPLQNSLIELWSLLHFLMPNIFTSQSEFRHWFATPLTKFIENHTSTISYTKTDVLKNTRSPSPKQNSNVPKNTSVISTVTSSDRDLLANLSENAPSFVQKLHSIINPFILRRKKEDVLKELPKKYEHVIKITLSLRQQKLYEDFISRKKTHRKLISGGYLGMMQILMKLRMVCNHPDIFEPRIVTSGLLFDPIDYVKAIKSYREEIMLTTLKTSSTPENKTNFHFDYFNLGHTQHNGNLVIEEIKDTTDTQHANYFSSETSTGVLHNALVNSNISRTMQKRETICKEAVPLYSKKLVSSLNFMDWSKSMSLPMVARSLESIEKEQKRACFIKTAKERVNESHMILNKIIGVSKKVVLRPPIESPFPKRLENIFEHINASNIRQMRNARADLEHRYSLQKSVFHDVEVAQRMLFPDAKLMEFDSGKLVFLKKLLSSLASRNTRNNTKNNKVLIFTQMTKMLDILETFLAQNNFTYVRLDGSTDIRRRQILMQKFNTDYNLFAFILSTRSGGLGINLTGANNVIFYDSDWNPQVDLQAQDRAHRIGQTRNVNIYRLVCEKSIEENIYIKQRQKRQLSFVSVDFKRMRNDLLANFAVDEDVENLKEPSKLDVETEEKEILTAMAQAEDEKDQKALKNLQSEQKEEEEEELGQQSETSKPEKDMSFDERLQNLSDVNKMNLKTRLKTVNFDKIVAESFANSGDNFEEFLNNDAASTSSSEFELDDQVSDTELLVAREDDFDVDDVENLYENFKHDILLGRYYRAFTGACWQEKYEKIIHNSVQSNGTKTTLRKYYYNIDTNEATYLRPAVLDGYSAQLKAIKHGWGSLPDSILQRIYLFLRGDSSFQTMKYVCLNFYLASKSPKLYVWVNYNVDAENQNRFNALKIKNLFTVGDRVECLHQKGEVFYAGVVAGIRLVQDAVTKEIYPVYKITYLDGSEENFVLEKYIRRDSGARFTFIYHDNKISKINKQRSRFQMTIRNLNKRHSSSFCCGVEVEYTVFKDIYSAIKHAYNGDTLVLKTGVHHLISRYNDYLHIFDKARRKHVRVITEVTLIKDLNLESIVDKIVWYDQLDGISTKMKSVRGVYLKDGITSVNRLVKNKYTKNMMFIKKRHLHPLSSVVLGGIELPFRSALAEIANKTENNNSYGINLVKQELEYGSLLVLHETSLFFTEITGSLVFHNILIYYNRINKDILRSNNLQNNKLQNMFILKGNCNIAFHRCLINCRFMINNTFRIMHSTSYLSLYKTILRSAKKTSVLLEAGMFASWRCHFANNATSAVTLRFGTCLFQGNLVTLKNNAGIIIENFPINKSLYAFNPYMAANSTINSMITQILAEKYDQKIKAILTGNVFDRKVGKNGIPIGNGPALEIHEVHRSIKICSKLDQDNHFGLSTPWYGQIIEKHLPKVQSIACYNNIFAENEELFQKPYLFTQAEAKKSLKLALRKESSLKNVFDTLTTKNFDYMRALEIKSINSEIFACAEASESENEAIEETGTYADKAITGAGKHSFSLRSTKVVIPFKKKRKRSVKAETETKIKEEPVEENPKPRRRRGRPRKSRKI